MPGQTRWDRAKILASPPVIRAHDMVMAMLNPAFRNKTPNIAEPNGKSDVPNERIDALNDETDAMNTSTTLMTNHGGDIMTNQTPMNAGAANIGHTVTGNHRSSGGVDVPSGETNKRNGQNTVGIGTTIMKIATIIATIIATKCSQNATKCNGDADMTNDVAIEDDMTAICVVGTAPRITNRLPLLVISLM